MCVCMYCMTPINKCPSIKSDSVERWRGEDLSGKYWPVKWASQIWGEGGGAALWCQEIGGSIQNFHFTILYPG